MRPSWGTAADLAELKSEMDKMQINFVDKGIPVIIGEYGCPKKNKDPESVNLFLSSVCKAAYDRQMCPVLWDITGLHYDRSTCTMTDPTLKALLNAIPEQKIGPLLGDLNLDGMINVSDIVVMQRYLVNNMALSTEQLALADVNVDGVINSFDLVALKALFFQKAA